MCLAVKEKLRSKIRNYRNGLYEVHDPRGLRAFGVDDGDNWQVVAPHRNMFD